MSYPCLSVITAWINGGLPRGLCLTMCSLHAAPHSHVCAVCCHHIVTPVRVPGNWPEHHHHVIMVGGVVRGAVGVGVGGCAGRGGGCGVRRRGGGCWEPWRAELSWSNHPPCCYPEMSVPAMYTLNADFVGDTIWMSAGIVNKPILLIHLKHNTL